MQNAIVLPYIGGDNATMDICTQTNIFSFRAAYPPEQTVSVLADAGWNAIDWSFFELLDGKGVWAAEGWQSRAEQVRKIADQRHVRIVQAHAPFPSGTGDPEKDETVFKMIVRSMEVSSVLGVRNIVVHPLKWIEGPDRREEAWNANLALYARLIPYCEKLGLCVCAENMKKYNRETKKFDVSFCGDPDTFCGFIDAIDSPYVKACLDVGHASLAGTDPAAFIHRLGPDRLKALHIQDVDGMDDRHNLPFQENLDWESICQALGEIGYAGWFTLEADNFMKKMPSALWPAAEAFMAKTARYLADRVEHYATNSTT